MEVTSAVRVAVMEGCAAICAMELEEMVNASIVQVQDMMIVVDLHAFFVMAQEKVNVLCVTVEGIINVMDVMEMV